MNYTQNKNEKKGIYFAILIISILCLGLAIIIELERTKYSLNHNNFCSAITGTNACETVQTSEYGRTFGINNPIYGIIGFAMLGIFAAISMYRPIRSIEYLTIIGGICAGLIAIWFLYVQAFILHEYCLFCVIVDILSLILLGISSYLLRKRF